MNRHEFEQCYLYYMIKAIVLHIYIYIYILQLKFNVHIYIYIYILQLKFNVHIYIYIYILQLKFNVHIYKIRENRYNAVKLSPHMFIALFKYVALFKLIMQSIQWKHSFNE